MTQLDERKQPAGALWGPAEMRSLVDTERGTISRRIFVDDEIFERELEHLFTRTWLFVGHETQIPEPGDYFVSRMGSDSVLLVRDTEHQVQVLLNTCRHRGMKICRYDQGNTTEFTCPYHGWSYSVDGSLVSTPGDLYAVPFAREAYGDDLDKSQWGLIRAPQVANYNGLVFANWDPTAPSFESYLGDFHHWLDNLTESADGRPRNVEVFAGVQKWRFRSNWKFVVENFLGDIAHAMPTHTSVEAVGIGPGGSKKSRHGDTEEGTQRRMHSNRETSFVTLGHGSPGTVWDETPYPDFEEAELANYFAQAWETRRKRYEKEGRPLGARGPATLFPSMSFHSRGFPLTILVAHPIGPRETELWRWYLVDKDAPRSVRDWLRHYYLRYSGPAGLTEQDDMENWDYATEASTGAVARRYPYNYQQGLGMTEPSPILEGAVQSTELLTEENARNFYWRWAQLTSGQSWDEMSS